MPVDKELDRLGAADVEHMRGKGGNLGGVLGQEAPESVAAHPLGAPVGVPVGGPVAVQICAFAAAFPTDLTVLSPIAKLRLGECESVWVDDGDDVKVVVVERVGDIWVLVVEGQESMSNVLGYHSGDPFSGVRCAVQDYGWINPWARLAPEVDALDVALLKGLAGGEDSRLAAVKVMEPVEVQFMGLDGVVALVPVLVFVGDCSGQGSAK